MNPVVSTAIPALAPDDIHRAAAEVLARPDYHLDEVSNQLASVLESMKHTLGRILEKIFGPIFRTVDDLFAISPVLGWLFITVLVILLVALLGHIGYTYYRVIRVRREQAFREMEILADSTPEDWEARARLAATRQDYIGAVRALFHATLLRLQTTLKQPPRRGATNREVLRRYRDTPAFPFLLQFVETIDLKWYGGGECLESDYQLCAQAHQRLREAAGELSHAQSA